MRLAVLSAMLIGFATPAFGQSTDVAKPAVVMTDELWGRVIKRTLAAKVGMSLKREIAELWGINSASSTAADELPGHKVRSGNHSVLIPVQSSDDVIVTVHSEGLIDLYLTDRSRRLRAAAMSDRHVRLRLVPVEQAKEKYNAEMAYLATIAVQLPPE